MEARNRSLSEWFARISTRQISLPRFQRNVAWGNNEVAGLLTTVLRQLPGGATLTLEVGDELPFISRTMVDAPSEGDRITELLLDGQQRLTALWRALNDKYPDRTYLVWFEDDPHKQGEKLPSVFGQSRYVRDGRRYPLWVDDPQQAWDRGYIPLKLLRPGDINEEIDQWIEAIAGEDHLMSRDIYRVIIDLRNKVATFNLPFLSLPVSTPREVALEVFIKMNTSSVPLSTFDIIVAQMEAEAGESLHDMLTKLQAAAPHAGEYEEPEDLILNIAALMQDRSPNQAGYSRLHLGKMVEDWPKLTDNISKMVEFLESQKIFDSARLPTEPILAVIAALFGDMPVQPDAQGNARRMLRKFLWRAIFTSRYDRAAATAALNDYRALREVFNERAPESSVPAFNEKDYPLVTIEELKEAGWPKNRNTLGRGILALSILAGARDIADDMVATRQHLKQREYHHLFPNSLLQDAELTKEEIFRSLNCALITWRTNRTISNKEPMVYLRDRAEANTLGEQDLQSRLQSHLIDFESLNVGGWTDLSKADRATEIRNAYENFLSARAELIYPYIQLVCSGVVPTFAQ